MKPSNLNAAAFYAVLISAALIDPSFAANNNEWVDKTTSIFDMLRENIVIVGASLMAMSFVGQMAWFGTFGHLDTQRIMKTIYSSIGIGFGGAFFSWIFAQMASA